VHDATELLVISFIVRLSNARDSLSNHECSLSGAATKACRFAPAKQQPATMAIAN